MDKKNSIKVENVSKTFRIPHEKINSVRGAAINLFRSGGYEEFKALDDISFEVKKGEFFGIIGRNGSGKSTLLKILAGIYNPDKGKVQVDGMISPFLELGIGFNPELSGRDNIYLNATVLGMTKKQIDEKFDSIVKFSELERFIDQKLKNYSSGMSVRLAFSVSVHANREILLMDEVLAVGDTNFQKKCIDVFRNYRSKNKTVVLVTHDISSVRKYCSRAMLLHNGEMVKIGDVDEVCDEYVMKNITTEARKELKTNDKAKYGEDDRERILQSKLKNKTQTVMDIKVLDSNGKELLATTRGNDFFVDVEISIKEIQENLNLAVQIWDRDTGCFVSGNNTRVDNFDCNWKKGDNIIKLHFANHNLNKGNFYVKAVLFEYKGEGEKVLALDEFSTLEKNYFFISELKNSGWGAVYLNHKWQKDDKK